MEKRSATIVLIALAYLGFVSLGLPDGLLGVAWPSIRAFFHLPLNALGAFLLMFTLGYLASSTYSGWLLTRMNLGVILALSCLATAVSLLGYALTPRWSGMVLLAVLAGLGAGGIDAGINIYAATHWSARMVNWSHACYGVGTTTGPAIMTAVLGAQLPWQWGYIVVGLAQLLLALAFGLTCQQWPGLHTTTEPQRTTSRAPWQDTARLPMVWLSLGVFFVYTGLEAAIGAWAYSLFYEARGVPMETAGKWVSVYWGGLMVGRIAAGLVVGRIATDVLLRYCMVSIVGGAVCIWLNVSSMGNFAGLALLGLACAPIFPSLIATTPARLGDTHAAHAIGWQIAAAVLGQSLWPSALGVLAHLLGLQVIAPMFCGMALLLLGLFLVLTTTSSQKQVVMLSSPSTQG